MSALSAPSRPLPRSLSYYVGKVAGFRRQNVKIIPQGLSSGILPSTTVRIVLPSNSLVDLETFALWFDLVVPANNVAPADIDTALIQSLQVEVGGVQIANISNYNQLMQALWSWTAGSDNRARRAFNQFGNGAVVAPVGTRKVCMNNWLPLQTKPAVLDTGLTGDWVITINLASRFILGALTANRADYTINNLYGSIDVISFADDSYSRMLREAVAGGVVLECPFPTAQGYLQLVSSMSQSTRFVASSGSIDMLIATPVQSAYDSDTNSATVYSTDLTEYFKKEGDNVVDFQFTVNGTAVPAYPVLQGYLPSWNAQQLGMAYDLLGGHNITDSTRNNEHSAYFLKLNATTLPDERLISGLSTALTNAQFEFKTTGTAQSIIVFVWCMMTSVLRVGASRQIELVM